MIPSHVLISDSWYLLIAGCETCQIMSNIVNIFCSCLIISLIITYGIGAVLIYWLDLGNLARRSAISRVWVWAKSQVTNHKRNVKTSSSVLCKSMHVHFDLRSVSVAATWVRLTSQPLDSVTRSFQNAVCSANGTATSCHFRKKIN